MWKAALLIALLCTPLAAHPLDDNADRKAQLRVVRGGLELVVEFHYRNVMASYTEFSNKLDRNNDGTVIRAEVTQRFIDLAGELAFDTNLFVDGERVGVEPDYDRFEFRDLDNPDADITAGIATPSARIFYKFVFVASAAPLKPGKHEVQLYFSGTISGVYNPSEQLSAADADGKALAPEYDIALKAFRRMTFEVTVEPPPAPPQPPPKPAPEPAPEPNAPAPPLGNLPAWVVHLVGGALGLLGLLLLGVRVIRKRGSWVAPLVLLLASGAIIMGALMRAGGLHAA
jgi:hypothetical protein